VSQDLEIPVSTLFQYFENPIRVIVLEQNLDPRFECGRQRIQTRDVKVIGMNV
jgi:hypothetical protein